jgi:MFS family permease
MGRSLAFVVTGVSAAPLLALAGFALTNVLARKGPGSDSTIAAGYIGVLGGLALAGVGFFVVGYLAQRFVGPAHLRYLLVVDAVLLIAGVVAWRGLLAESPRLEYADQRAILEVEARIPKSRLGGASLESASIDFTGGPDASVPHPEAARDDGDAMILPWETTPIRVKRWEVRVFVRNAPSLFTLRLPARPEPSTEWSDWIRPSARDGSTAPDGLTLRYRFLLRPHGS